MKLGGGRGEDCGRRRIDAWGCCRRVGAKCHTGAVGKTRPRGSDACLTVVAAGRAARGTRHKSRGPLTRGAVGGARAGCTTGQKGTVGAGGPASTNWLAHRVGGLSGGSSDKVSWGTGGDVATHTIGGERGSGKNVLIVESTEGCVGAAQVGGGGGWS